MKLLNRREQTPVPPEMMGTLAICVAHRCVEHKDIPPLNLKEGNGSSECGVCCAEEFGQSFAARALEIQEERLLLPVLDGYADRLAHHALLVRTLERARDQMRLLGLDVRFIQEVLRGNL